MELQNFHQFFFDIECLYDYGRFRILFVQRVPDSQPNTNEQALARKVYELTHESEFILKRSKVTDDDSLIDMHSKNEWIIGTAMYSRGPHQFVAIDSLVPADIGIVLPRYPWTLANMTETSIDFWKHAMIQLFSAVDTCHKYAVVHRDIKPANVFITTDFNVRLGDWDISVTLPQSNDAPLTVPYFDFFIGSLEYQVPMKRSWINDMRRLPRCMFFVHDYYGLGMTLIDIANHLRLGKTKTLECASRFRMISDKMTVRLSIDDKPIICPNTLFDEFTTSLPADLQDEMFLARIIWCRSYYLAKDNSIEQVCIMATLCQYYETANCKDAARRDVLLFLNLPIIQVPNYEVATAKTLVLLYRRNMILEAMIQRDLLILRGMQVICSCVKSEKKIKKSTGCTIRWLICTH